MNAPRTHRGYHWQESELEDFREFKRLGHIARQARPERYAIDYSYPTRAGVRYAKLYMNTRGPWETCIAGLILSA